VSRNALDVTPSGDIGDHPDNGLGGNIGREVADHSEMVLRERSERGLEGSVEAGVHGLEDL
jgi:hypothetical protein